jgi:hypothetical protein
MDNNGLTPYQLAQLREALDQGGLDGGGKLAGGLVLGNGVDGPGAGAGDVRISGSVRESLALGAGVYRDSAQTIPNAAFTAVEFSTEWFDADNCFSVGSPTRLTARTGGVYIIYGNVVWVYNAAGQRYLVIRLNGGRYIAIGTIASVTGGAYGPYQNIAGVFFLNEGDYVELLVQQTCGTALDIRFAAGVLQPEFAMVRVA